MFNKEILETQMVQMSQDFIDAHEGQVQSMMITTEFKEGIALTMLADGPGDAILLAAQSLVRVVKAAIRDDAVSETCFRAVITSLDIMDVMHHSGSDSEETTH